MRSICNILSAIPKRKSYSKLIIPALLAILASGVAAENKGREEPRQAGIPLFDAVVKTIEKQQNIAFQKQEAELFRGRSLEARGQFDAIFGASASHNHEQTPLSLADRLSFGLKKITTDTTSSQVDITKQFRTGITILPNVKITRIDTSPSEISPTNNSEANFLIILPLLKGRGAKTTAANEMAAEMEYATSLLDLQHAVSLSVRDTVFSYWNYLAEKRNLDQLIESEARAQKMVNDIQKLIDADEMPASELEQAKANLADKSALRIAGEQRLLEAKRILGLAMGIGAEEIKLLPLPADDFPRMNLDEVNQLMPKADSFVDQALLQRSDLHAAKRRQESTKILLEAAKHNLLPRLNMEVNVGYRGLDEGEELRNFVQSISDNVPGASTSLSLRYEWPFNNNLERGLLVQRAAFYQQAIIRTDALINDISSGVMLALSALLNSTLELSKAQKSVRSYRTALQNEAKKLQLGMATLLDLIVVEERMTNALSTEIAAQLKFAQALSNLRYETGALLVTEDEKISVDKSYLNTFPFPSGR